MRAHNGGMGHPQEFSQLVYWQMVIAQPSQHCGTSIAGAPQAACEAYDRIEIAAIAPHISRVTLYGGHVLAAPNGSKAMPPQGLEPGSPFGPNLLAFALYLRFTHAISFGAEATPMRSDAPAGFRRSKNYASMQEFECTPSA
jgi:hypothetical protein